MADFAAVELTNGGAFAKAAEVFRKYDADGSGELDKAELVLALTELGILEDVGAKHAGKALEAQLREADANGDGRISWKEFGAYFNRMAQLKAAELRAGRLHKKARVQVPSSLFSDPQVQVAFTHFAEFGAARALGERAGAARERQMTTQQFKRMLEVTGLVEGLGSLAAADIIFARSRPPGATKLRFQSFLTALVMLAEESDTGLHTVVQQLVGCLGKKLPGATRPASPASKAVSRTPGRGKAGRPGSPLDSPTIAARRGSHNAPLAPACASPGDCGAAESAPDADNPAPAVSISPGPCTGLLNRLGYIQQLLAPPASSPALLGTERPHTPGAVAASLAASPNGCVPAGTAGQMVPLDVVQLVVREVLAQARQQPAAAGDVGKPPGASTAAGSVGVKALAATEGSQAVEWGGSVVDNAEFQAAAGQPSGGAPQGDGEEGQLEERPLTLQEAHSLKADTWRNTDQRCAVTEARCAALAAAQAQASEHAFQAVRLGLAGLQEEAARLAVAEQEHAAGLLRAFEARADQLQRQVDALEAILRDSPLPAEVLQEARASREECARGMAALEERMAARERKMGEALLQLARRMAELDARAAGTAHGRAGYQGGWHGDGLSARRQGTGEGGAAEWGGLQLNGDLGNEQLPFFPR